jgi:hypothetical protein
LEGEDQFAKRIVVAGLGTSNECSLLVFVEAFCLPLALRLNSIALPFSAVADEVDDMHL